MAKIYIAGPMRGYPRWNLPAFFAAEKELKALGWEVFNPGSFAPPHGDSWQTDPYKKIPAYRNRAYAERDVAVLLSFRGEDGDSIFMLKGWMRSAGALAEHALATWINLRIYYEDENGYYPDPPYSV